MVSGFQAPRSTKSSPPPSSLFFLLVLSLSFQTRATVQDLLPPLIGNSCSDVSCGRGRCKASTNSSFLGLLKVPAFTCECDPGWTRLWEEDGLKFLPCVIPKCSLNYSCSKVEPAPASAPAPPSNFLNFDSCSFSYCGEGTCVRTSIWSHECNCKPGTNNLLNISFFPCFSNCVISLNCSNLLIGAPGTLSPPPPSQSNTSSAFLQSKQAKILLVVLFLLLVFF